MCFQHVSCVFAHTPSWVLKKRSVNPKNILHYLKIISHKEIRKKSKDVAHCLGILDRSSDHLLNAIFFISLLFGSNRLSVEIISVV